MGNLTNFMNKIANKYENLWCDNDIQPKISVIIPAYNVEKYIEKCLASLLNQTFKDFETIIINDGSTDLTLEIANVFQHCDKRFKLITSKNQGVSIARNIGIKNAIAPYISFIDSDDWIDNDFLENHYKAITENDADISASSIIRWRKNSKKYRVHYTEEKIYETLKDKIEVCDIPKCCYVWNKLYRATLIKNKIFEEGKYFEDILWIPEIIKASNRLVTVPNINYYYRVTQGSIVKKNSPEKQNDSYNAKKYIIKFFDENNLKLSNKARTITKEIKYFLNIPVLRIKEYEEFETYLLFSLIKLFTKKTSLNRVFYNFLGLKITKRKNKLPNKEYEKINKDFENGIGKIPKVKNKYETLDELINSNKSISRYGDGEFNLIFEESLPFQKYSLKLSKRLEEILVSQNNNILIAIPDVFNKLNQYNNNAQLFWRKYIVINRDNIYKKLNMNKQYFDTETTRPYMDIEDKYKCKEYFLNFKKVWNNKDIIFVEGAMSRLGYKNDLFDNAKSIKRIICPAKDAFDKYNEILEICKKQDKNSLFIIALGPTATVLAYDLSNLGYRALDLGHIDIEYEWFKLGVNKKVAIKDKYVNEVKKGRKITDINDKKYQEQIIYSCEVIDE